MVNIDLHIHTSFGSPCAELHDPETLPGSMGKNLVHGIVITEHNMMWPMDRIRKINNLLPPGRRIYSGMEVSTSCFHVVVIGLDSQEEIYSGINPLKLVEIARRHNAVTILVHPFQNDQALASNMALINSFDCMEIASTMTIGNMRRKTIDLCIGAGSIPVAGSDAHCRENLGKAYTSFPYLPDDEKELAVMIKKRKGIPMARENNGEKLILC